MSSSLFSKIDIHFPAPDYLTFNPVALEIGSDSIKVFKFKKTDLGFLPDFFKEVKLEKKNNFTNITQNKEINSEYIGELIEKLKDLKKEFKLKYIVSSLPELETYIFRTRLPKEVISDVASAIRFQVEENVPLKKEEVNFDYHILDNVNNNEHFDVVVSVFPKTIIEFYTKIFKMADLYPISFQSESVALAQSLVTKHDKGTYLLLNLDADKVTVVIVEDEAIQYASTFFVNIKEAVNNFESKSAKELNEFLNKLLIFWFTNKKDVVQHNKIETAIISGEYSSYPGVESFLEKKLQLNVDPGNVWVNCFSTDKYLPEIKKEDSIRFAVVIGLALKSIKHA